METLGPVSKANLSPPKILDKTIPQMYKIRFPFSIKSPKEKPFAFVNPKGFYAII